MKEWGYGGQPTCHQLARVVGMLGTPLCLLISGVLSIATQAPPHREIGPVELPGAEHVHITQAHCTHDITVKWAPMQVQGQQLET